MFGKQVTVEWQKLDRYKRVVGKILIADPACTKSDCLKTADVGLSQISVGLAWWYRKYAKDQLPEDRQRYDLAENEARAEKLGLWSERNPMPPWEFRHAKML